LAENFLLLDELIFSANHFRQIISSKSLRDVFIKQDSAGGIQLL